MSETITKFNQFFEIEARENVANPGSWRIVQNDIRDIANQFDLAEISISATMSDSIGRKVYVAIRGKRIAETLEAGFTIVGFLRGRGHFAEQIGR